MQLKFGYAMLTGGIYAIATAIMSTMVATSTLAAPFNITENQPSLQRNEFLLAQDYRHQRHVELEQQMRNQMNQPQNSTLFQSQKENIIRQSHETLDRDLDRQREQFRRQLEDDYQRFSESSYCTGLSCSSRFPNSQPGSRFPSSPNCIGINCSSPSETFLRPNSSY